MIYKKREMNEMFFEGFSMNLSVHMGAHVYAISKMIN